MTIVEKLKGWGFETDNIVEIQSEAEQLLTMVDEGKACTRQLFTALGNETWSVQVV